MPDLQFRISQRRLGCLLFQRRPGVCSRRAKATVVLACVTSHLPLLLCTLGDQPGHQQPHSIPAPQELNRSTWFEKVEPRSLNLQATGR